MSSSLHSFFHVNLLYGDCKKYFAKYFVRRQFPYCSGVESSLLLLFTPPRSFLGRVPAGIRDVSPIQLSNMFRSKVTWTAGGGGGRWGTVGGEIAVALNNRARESSRPVAQASSCPPLVQEATAVAVAVVAPLRITSVIVFTRVKNSPTVYCYCRRRLSAGFSNRISKEYVCRPCVNLFRISYSIVRLSHTHAYNETEINLIYTYYYLLDYTKEQKNIFINVPYALTVVSLNHQRNFENTERIPSPNYISERILKGGYPRKYPFSYTMFLARTYNRYTYIYKESQRASFHFGVYIGRVDRGSGGVQEYIKRVNDLCSSQGHELYQAHKTCGSWQT
ncbi:hypothetical protein QTP88_005152 [Uroleucon formosanum]